MRVACTEMVHRLAQRDPRVVYLGSDLGAGILDDMKAEMPERFFMEGVSEANLIGVAAGLAMDGFIPFIHTIAAFFTRRAYEQLAVDLCMHRLPVRLIGNGGGLVYAPLGPTHMATEDLATMRSLPGMTVVAPADEDEMRRFMERTLDHPGPIYIRLAKGGDPVVTGECKGFEIGRGFLLRPAGQVLFVTTGVMAQRALEAAEELAQSGISSGVFHVPTVKPLDAAAILRLAKTSSLTVTVEEHTLIGGLGGAVAELFADQSLKTIGLRLLRLGLPDEFLSSYGSQNYLLERYGLDPSGIVASVRAALATGSAEAVLAGVAAVSGVHAS